ncbi:MAG: tetratricopeptide repeat protein, partial [Myxococcota bacterium]|nr:tetratricopeptide repeat protein [Myxococcota bacterium]
LLMTWISSLTGCAPAVSDKDRHLAQTHYEIAVTSFSGGDYREALRELLKSTKLNPELAEAHAILGMVYHALGRLDDGLFHYERAVSINPHFSAAYNNMGTLLIDLGRYDEAIDAFEVALGDILYKTPSLAEGNMGWAYYRMGKTAEGVKHIRNAVATNPKFCRGYEWLARIGLDRDASDEVARSYQRFEKYCAKDEEIGKILAPDTLHQMKYYFGLSLVKQGDRDAARAIFSQCALPDADVGFAVQCRTSLKELN